MAFTIKTLTALAALLVLAPSATALSGIANASSPLLPDTDADIGGITTTPRDESDPVTSILDEASAVLSEAGRLSTCRLAVPVQAIWYTGDVTDRRQSQGEWLLRHTWSWTTTEEVAVVTEVRQEVEATAGTVVGTVVDTVVDTVDPILAVSGAAPLVTDAGASAGTGAAQPLIEQVVTYTTVTRNHHMAGDALARGTWDEVYITWIGHEALWFVDPLGYAPADGLVAGKEQIVCEETVLSSVPLREGGRWTCLCLTAPEDGWHYVRHHVDVTLADASVYRTYERYSTVSDVHGALVADVEAALAALPVTERVLLDQAADRDAAWNPTAAAAPAAGDASLASSGASLIGASAAAGIGAAMAALLALLAAAVLRRRKET